MTGMWPSRSRRAWLRRGIVRSTVTPSRCCRTICFSQALVRFGLLIEEPYSSASLATQPLWRIAARIRRANRVDRPAADASRRPRAAASSSAIGSTAEPIVSDARCASRPCRRRGWTMSRCSAF